MMSKGYKVLAGVALALGLAAGSLAGEGSGPVKITGYILDSHCAEQSKEAGEAVCCKKAIAGGAEFEKCIKKCAEGEGVKLGIMHEGAFWTLDNQTMAKDNLGMEVTITGVADAAAHTLKVEAITKVEKKS